MGLILSDATLSSLIALTGVFFSLVISLFISIRQARIERQKLREEYLRLFAGKLFEKRIEVYPTLSCHIVELVHKINISAVTVDDIKSFYQILIQWDAKHAIYLSAEPQQMIHRIKHLLVDLNTMDAGKFERILDDKESVRQIKRPLLDLFLALKNDLGIFTIKSPSAVADIQAPASFIDVDRLSGLKVKRYSIDHIDDKNEVKIES